MPPHYVPGQLYPLVIQTHGFPEHEFMTDGVYTTAFAARALASHGIVVLQMESGSMIWSQHKKHRIEFLVSNRRSITLASEAWLTRKGSE